VLADDQLDLKEKECTEEDRGAKQDAGLGARLRGLTLQCG
jgi:hypothetical protein